jgi:methylated-DNA-[protein]-cysteine S-methyltransferase
MNTRHAIVGTQLGELTVVAEDDAVTGVYFPQHWTRPSLEAFGDPVLDLADDALLTAAANQLRQYLDAERTIFTLPVRAHGNAFQHRVWAILETIPIGATTTYGEIAEQLGDKSLAQLVGQAVGHNPLSIIVPCHRVVGKGGKLTGYAGGIERKQFLLELEETPQTAAARLF